MTLRCETRDGRPYALGLRADARALLELLSLQPYELSLVLTGDSAIRELNRVFRSQDRATDVLSFPQLEVPPHGRTEERVPNGSAMPAMLGDVVISMDTASRQARSQGITPELRLRTLLVHGVLHLLGYDHELSRADARRMFARERELLAALARGRGDRSSIVRRPEAERKRLTRSPSASSLSIGGSSAQR